MYIGDALLNKKYIEKTYCLIRCPSCPCFTLRHFEIEKTATYAYMYTSRNMIYMLRYACATMKSFLK